MSAQEFKPGAEMWARVDRWPAAKEWPDDTSRVHLVSDEAGFWSATDDDPAAPLCIPPSCAEYIHPLPEFVVGQQVSGSDYERLPVGSVVGDWTQVAPDQWSWCGRPGHVRATSMAAGGERTLTHLGAELADWERELLAEVDAEDKDDLYVEPEPLKGAGPAFNDDDVHHLKVISGSTTVFDGLAVFEEADNGNINVTPVPRCTSLGEKAGSILRCGRHEGHSDGHWTVGSTPAAAWSDERAYGRVVEGGAS